MRRFSWWFHGLSSVVVGWVLLGSAPVAVAQSAARGSSLPFHVTADTVEGKDGGRFLLARGNVRINRETWTLYADEVEVDQETEDFVAKGEILVFDRGNQIQGSALRFNYGTGRGVIYEARGLLTPATTFTAKEIYRDDERTYRLIDATYTTCGVCQTPPYDWEARASELTVHPDEFMWGLNGTLWLKGVPVLYVPAFRHPLTQRQTGLLTPIFGGNREEGFILNQQFFWAISDSQDATLGVIYRSDRGASPTLEYRYALEEGKGQFNAQYLHDRVEKKDRYLVQFKHNQAFTPNLAGNADINVRSDKDFPQQFGVRFLERTELINSSSAFLSYVLPEHTVTLAGQFQESRDPAVPKSGESVVRAPELSITTFPLPLFGEEGDPSRTLAPSDTPSLFFEQQSSIVHFQRRKDLDRERVDIRPRLSLPVPVTSYVTLTPVVALRETAYTRGAKDIEEDGVTREMVEAEASLESTFFRMFPVLGERLRAIRHTIEPKIRYLYIPEVTQDDLPQLDGIDFISPQNRVFLSLANRLSAHVREPSGDRRTYDFLAFTLENSVNLDPERRTFSENFLGSLQPENITQAVKDRRSKPNHPGFSTAQERRFSDLVASLSLVPLRPHEFKGSVAWNTEIDVIDVINASIGTGYPGLVKVEAGYTFRNPDTFKDRKEGREGVVGQVTVTPVKQLHLSYLLRYDLEFDRFQENQVEARYQTCCWAVTVLFTRREGEVGRDREDDIRVVFELLTTP